jgi:ATP-binding cassette subfamily C protein
MAPPAVRFLPSFRRFAVDFLKYGRGRAVVGALLAIFGAVLDSVGLLLLIPILGVVMDNPKDNSVWRRASTLLFEMVGARSIFERLAVLLVIYAALQVIRAIVFTTRDVKLAELQIGFLQHLRGQIAALLAAAPWTKLAGLLHTRITYLMSGDVQRVSTGSNFLIQAAVQSLMLVGYCTVSLIVAPKLTAIALAMFAVIGFGVMPLVRRSQLLGRFVTESNLTMLGATSQFLGGLKLAISQNLQTSFTREFGETLRLLTARQVDNVRQSAFARLAFNLLASAVAAVIVLVGFGVLHTPTAVLLPLLWMISRMNGPVTQIQQGIQQVAYALPAYDTVLALKDELATAADAAPAAPTGPFPEGAIVFEAVSYRHATQQGAAERSRGVQGLDLVLRPGDFVGVAGPSGAGKTTFADLLVGLLSPQQGRITVGGAALEGATLEAWREGMSYVSQDPFLFHDTVRHNLAWGAPQVSEAEMWRALALVEAEGLVRRMDKGLDTLVGDRGALVSGGERQRIALARALLRAPRLLVLDEATNAIDIASERALMERLDALSPRPTIVMIAHRSESLALCRSVLRLEEGRLCDVSASDAAPGPLAVAL